MCSIIQVGKKKKSTGIQGIKGMKKKESLKIPSIPFIPVKFWSFLESGDGRHAPS
jgi:hypothetical protein